MSSADIEKPVQPPPLPGGSVCVDPANGQSDKLERIMGWGSAHSAWYYIANGMSQGPVSTGLLRAICGRRMRKDAWCWLAVATRSAT